MITAIYKYPIPTIDIDDTYYLRPQRIEDTEDFFTYYGDEEVGKHILAKTPKSLEDAKAEVEYCIKLFQYKQGIYWAIARKSDDKMIGAVGFYMNNHHHRGELCYDLHKGYWRQGIMTRAINRAMEYMFRYGGVHRIEAITVKDNIASINLLKKIGFAYEGSLCNYRYYNNKSHNVEMFGLTQKMMKSAK